jgi:predicted DNA-binding antitoxin AbrB/MazE fold protein
MINHIDATFENGAFYLAVPVGIPDGTRVTLDIAVKAPIDDDLRDIQDLLDHDFMESCRRSRTVAPTLEEVQKILSKFKGSLAQYISEDREER